MCSAPKVAAPPAPPPSPPAIPQQTIAPPRIVSRTRVTRGARSLTIAGRAQNAQRRLAIGRREQSRLGARSLALPRRPATAAEIGRRTRRRAAAARPQGRQVLVSGARPAVPAPPGAPPGRNQRLNQFFANQNLGITPP